MLTLLVTPLAWSYGRAMTYPGSASWSVRSVDWLRSHGGAGIVNQLEVWYYSRQQPPTSGTPTVPAPAPDATQTRLVDAARRAGQGPVLRPAVTPALRGEARWTPGPTTSAKRITTYTTWFRPDPAHPTLVAGALWLDRSATKLDLVAGTKEPGGAWPGAAQVPPSQRRATVAAFNSGFLMRDSGGGFFEDARTVGRLQTGAASLVIDRSGSVQVGQWGRDVRLTAGTHAVRQNLHLIVDGSKPVKGLVHNAQSQWGSRRSQLQWTWRSGLGVDRSGNVVYVAGNHFSLTTLADALAQAGAVRAMELDIHTPMVSANIYRLGQGDHRRAPVKLLPTMNRPATRYLSPDQRDFLTATIR